MRLIQLSLYTARAAARYRHDLLLKIAEVIEANMDYLAAVETIDNGKPIRESRNADLPLMIDYFLILCQYHHR